MPTVPTAVVRVTAAIIFLAWSAIAIREITNASRFQLFGDYVARVETTAPVVAITFDDGPHPEYTVRVLDILDRHGVRATFFMMGINVERYPDVAREVIRRGHEAGNHSYSHQRMTFMWPSAIEADIERTEVLLRDIGAAHAIAFRPPHLSKFLGLPWVLRRMGKLSVLVDVDPEEWSQRGSDAMTRTIHQDTRPGSIIGLHDPNGPDTLKTLDDSLAALKSRGYQFETIAELIRRRSGL